jgi:hypothetical protein
MLPLHFLSISRDFLSPIRLVSLRCKEERKKERRKERKKERKKERERERERRSITYRFFSRRLLNLLSNAIVYTREGLISLNVHV